MCIRDRTYTEPFYLIGLNDGTYFIDYNSTDLAGNIEVTNIITIILDNTPPNTTLTVGEPKYVSDTTYITPETLLTFEAYDGTGSGVYSIYYRIYNSTFNSGWLDYTGPFCLILLNNGAYTIEFFSIDNLGNEELIKNLIITSDNLSPSTELIIAPCSSDDAGNIYISSETNFILVASDEFSDVANTFYRLNGGPWLEYLGVFNLTGPLGLYTIDYYSVDNLGNIEAIKTTIVILENEFEGFGILRVNGQLFIGAANMSVSEDIIKMEIDDQIVTWDVIKHCKCGFMEVYTGEGELGKIRVFIFNFGSSSYIFAIGKGVFFSGCA